MVRTPLLLAALAAVAVAGAVTLWYWSQLLAYNMDGLAPGRVEPDLLASAALPTGLLTSAVAIGRRDARLLRWVIAVAGCAAAVQVLTIRSELAAPWTRGTGLASFLALVAGGTAAACVLVAAGVAALRRHVRSRTRDATG